jgi:hypothetical protein
VRHTDALVFTGPSLDAASARALLPGADVRGPAAQGDIVRGVLAGARRVVLLDGVFGAVPAVRHAEILWAMAGGVAVVGAASLGAIRAAELADVGMEGVGVVYRWFRRTPLADDEEVAVAVAPAELGFAAVSEALVDVRLTLAAARRAGVVSVAACRAITAVARDVPFVERSVPRILEEAARRNIAAETLDRLGRFLSAGTVRQKRADAVACLRAVAAGRVGREPPPVAFRLTEAWAADLDDAGLLDAVRLAIRY